MTDSSQVQEREGPGFFVFFVLAFGVPWTGWIVYDRTSRPSDALELLTMFWLPAAVSVAGFVAATVEGGWQGLSPFVRRTLSLRFHPLVWLLALLLPLVAGTLTFVMHVSDLWTQGPPVLARFSSFVTLANLWTGPLGEEFGWRGYLLSRLERRLSPVLAGLAIGPIWTLWHVPLLYDSAFAHLSSAIRFTLTTTAWSVVLAVMVTRARGSVLPSILAHFTINNQAFFFAALLSTLPRDRLPGGWSFCWASMLVAASVAVIECWFPQRYANSIPAPSST